MLTDKFRRTITYLRISVTDRCNLKCRYCSSAAQNIDGNNTENRGCSDGNRKNEILTFEEIILICRAARDFFSIKNLRLTGGEPLLRRGIETLVAKFSDDGFRVSMTTNGTLLTRETAAKLKKSGLSGINISLDTLSPALYSRITGGADIQDVLNGIDAAVESGFTGKVKINAVVDPNREGGSRPRPESGMKENVEEALKFLRWSSEKGLVVKFIEQMPFGEGRGKDVGDAFDFFEKFIAEKLSLVKSAANLKNGMGPARYYTTPDGKTEVGFIAALSRPFCDMCNRLRLAADGKLLPCLGHPDYVDLKQILRGGKDWSTIKGEIAQALRQAADMKPQNHAGFKRAGCVNMISVGG